MIIASVKTSSLEGVGAADDFPGGQAAERLRPARGRHVAGRQQGADEVARGRGSRIEDAERHHHAFTEVERAVRDDLREQARRCRRRLGAGRVGDEAERGHQDAGAQRHAQDSTPIIRPLPRTSPMLGWRAMISASTSMV